MVVCGSWCGWWWWLFVEGGLMLCGGGMLCVPACVVLSDGEVAIEIDFCNFPLQIFFHCYPSEINNPCRKSGLL